MVWSSSPYILNFHMRALGLETLLKAHLPPSTHFHDEPFHCRRQTGWLFLIASLSCLSLETGSKRGSCTIIFAGTEVRQQLTAFQILFFVVLEYDCNVFSIHHDFSQTIHRGLAITAASKAATAASFFSTFKSVPGRWVCPDKVASNLFTQYWLLLKLLWYLQASGRTFCLWWAR